jgi:uncharacterized protein involved in outer membrane biogenesis
MNASTPRKRIPTWARIALIVFGVIVVIGLIAPYFLDVDRYRTLIATTLETQTGRKVNIGKIRARFIPTVGFTVEDFHIGNPTNFPAGDLVSVDSVKGSLAWLPLLHKDIQVTSIELVNPKLNLLSDDSGKTNYDFPSKAPSQSGGGGSSMTLGVIGSLNLSGIEMTVGRVSRGKIFTDMTGGKLDVSLQDVALDPIDVKQWSGSAKLSGVQLTMAGWKEPLKFNSGAVELDHGKLDVDFEAALGKAADFKGTIAVADLDKGVSTFQLSTNQIDFDQLIASQETTASPTSAPRQVTKPEKSVLISSGHISAERLRWLPYTANNLTAEVRVFNDRIEVWPLTLALYGGTLQISARADRTQDPPRFSANIQLRNIDVNGAFSAVSPSQKGKVTGTAELDLQLIGSVAGNWQKPLSGNGKFTVSNGKLPGLNMGGVGGALASSLNLKEIPYRTVTGDLEIASERVSSKNIHLDSPDGVIDAVGSFGLDSTLNYQAKVELSGGAGGGGQGVGGAITGILGQVTKQTIGRITVPVSVRGTFSDPKVTPGMPTMGATKSTGNNATPSKTSVLDLFKKKK